MVLCTSYMSILRKAIIDMTNPNVVETQHVTGQRVLEERDRLTAAIDDGSYREQHNKLYAARQALCWALNPESARSPYLTIMGTQAGPEDCLAEPCPPGS